MYGTVSCISHYLAGCSKNCKILNPVQATFCRVIKFTPNDTLLWLFPGHMCSLFIMSPWALSRRVHHAPFAFINPCPFVPRKNGAWRSRLKNSFRKFQKFQRKSIYVITSGHFRFEVDRKWFSWGFQNGEFFTDQPPTKSFWVSTTVFSRKLRKIYPR